MSQPKEQEEEDDIEDRIFGADARVIVQKGKVRYLLRRACMRSRVVSPVQTQHPSRGAGGGGGGGRGRGRGRGGKGRR